MTTVSSTFAAKGASTAIPCRKGSRVSWVVTGAFVATWHLQRKVDLANWENVRTFVSVGSTDGIDIPEDGTYRLFCSARTSGTITYALTGTTTAVVQEVIGRNGVALLQRTDDSYQTFVRTGQKRIYSVGKAGTTSGWLVAPADNLGLGATLPASKTASTLVVRISGLKVGDMITGFHLIGQIESAGATATLDADLRKHTAAAADVADASVGAMTQLSVTAQTIVSSANAGKTGLTEVVGDDETFYVLITGTTEALTDVALQGVAVIVTEA